MSGFNSKMITPREYLCSQLKQAWVHFFTMNLRTQLKDTKIRVVEIVPPSVGTDLHRDRTDPDDNKKHKNKSALTVEEFMEYLTKGWKDNLDTIGAGMGVEASSKILMTVTSMLIPLSWWISGIALSESSMRNRQRASSRERCNETSGCGGAVMVSRPHDECDVSCMNGGTSTGCKSDVQTFHIHTGLKVIAYTMFTSRCHTYLPPEASHPSIKCWMYGIEHIGVFISNLSCDAEHEVW